jgi:exosortase/archaeosortase family protein
MTGRVFAKLRSIPKVWLLLAVLLAALWPHWFWMARRLTDGSDEPWGILAALTVVALVARDRDRLVLPPRNRLIGTALLMLASAAIGPFAPPLAAAASAMIALGIFLAGALPTRPAAPLVTLLLLALPIIASLQFYLGYPLRLATAHAAAPLLALAGFDVIARGAAFEFAGRTILVDPPCAGIAMLWLGSYTAALLSYLDGAGARHTMTNGIVAAAAVFAANVLRNALLFFTEAAIVPAPAWAHDAIGLGAFAFAVIPIVAFAHRRWR